MPPRKSNHSDAITKLTESARRGELVAIIGSGVSVAPTNNKVPVLSWKGLVANGLAHGVKKGKITADQEKNCQKQLASNDLGDLLAAAEFVGRKLDAPNGDLYARWLENVFNPVQPSNKKMEDAIKTLNAARIRLCTLNYDPLLERVTGLPSVNLTETAKVTEWMRSPNTAVLHLHGIWDAPATCILGIRDYQSTLGNDVRDLIQRSLGSLKRLLFIGCGDTFAGPNFSALMKWLSGRKSAPPHSNTTRSLPNPR